jgi:hypothetical protein
VSLFDTLGSVLQGSSVNASVTLQADQLTGLVTTVGKLIDEPPDDFQDFLTAVSEAPLPKLDIAGSLGASFEAIDDLIPSDLGDVLGDLTGTLGDIEARVRTELTGPLADAIAAVTAVHTLLTTDLSCGLATSRSLAPGGDGGDGAGDDGGAPDPAASAPPAGSPGGTPQPSDADIDSANATLDLLPSPLDVDSLLHWLHDVLGTEVPPLLLVRALPVLDDIRDPLATLIAWEGMNAQQIVGQLQSSLQSVATLVDSSIEGVLDAPFDALNALAPRLQVSSLAEIADGLSARLVEIGAAIEAGDLSTTAAAVAEIGTRLDALGALRVDFEAQVEPALATLVPTLAVLTDDLTDAMEHVVSVLAPSGHLGRLTQFGQWPTEIPPFDPGVLGDVQEALGNLTGWIRDVVHAIDLSALQAPLGAAAEALRAAVDGIDQAMVLASLAVESQLEGVTAALDDIDLAALTDDVEDAIASFRDTLVEQLAEAFEPARTALAASVGAIDTATDAFDPGAIVAELQGLLDDLTGVFSDPAVTGALDDIRSTLDAVGSAVESLSFAPVTDVVIQGIDEIGDALASIDTSDMSDALKVALAAALKVLPDDIEPITDPFVEDFGQLLADGPLPLLDAVKAQPQKLFDQVRAFEPTQLLGDTLSKPYAALLARMQDYKPSALLAPVQKEIDGLKQRLLDSADPAQALQPLIALRDELRGRLEALRPSTLVQPLEARLQALIDEIIDQLPADEISAQLGAIIDFLQDRLGIFSRLAQLLTRVRDLTTGLADARSQLDTWLGSVLDRIAALGDTSALTATLGAVADSLDATRAGALTSRLDVNAAALLTALETLDPQRRITAANQAAHALSRTALTALPASPQKDAVNATLTRVDSLLPVLNDALRALADLDDTMNAAEATFDGALAGWDARFHLAGGVLDGFRQPNAAPAQIRAWIEGELEAQMTQPLRAAFTALEQVQHLLALFIEPFAAMVADLQGIIDGLITGPDGLAGIRDAFDALIERLRDVDFGFVTDSLDEIFDAVVGQLDDVDLAGVSAALRDAFQQMLDQLDLNAIVPAGALDDIDADFQEVLDKLAALDPGKVVTDVVQPVYEAQLGTLLDTFDVSTLLETVVAKLAGLEDELKGEMERVNDAYKQLLQSVPDVGSVSVSVGF